MLYCWIWIFAKRGFWRSICFQIIVKLIGWDPQFTEVDTPILFLERKMTWKNKLAGGSHIIWWLNVSAFGSIIISLLCKLLRTASYFSLEGYVKSTGEENASLNIQDTKNHFVKGWYSSNGWWNEPYLLKNGDVIVVLKPFWE